MIKDIEILIIYSSDSGREATFNDIVNEKSWIDDEHYESSPFWNCGGGLSICINQYNIILNSSNFYNLVKVTSFLIHSLYWLKEMKNDWFVNNNDEYPNDVVIRTTTGELLRLTKNEENEIIISFTHPEIGHNHQRGERYFENIIIDKVSWFSAATIGMNEYFEVLLRIAKSSSDETGNTMLMQYYHEWQALG